MFVNLISVTILICLSYTSICPFIAADVEHTVISHQASNLCSSPSIKNVNETEIGSHLGSVQNGYIAYSFNSTNFKTLNVSLEIKTFEKSGIIFYVIGLAKKDFYGIYIKQSELQVSYHCDGYLNSYSIRVPINDGKWHKIQFSSDKTKTELIIDNNFYTGRTSGCKKPALVSPYYFGSVDKVKYETAKMHLENQNKPFIGCMRSMNVDKYEQLTSFGVLPCPKNAESGIFFSGNESYAVVHENFKPERKLQIKMKIKPKTNNGILVFFHAKDVNNYLIVELLQGVIKFTIENGNGPLSTSLNSTDLFNFCDGKWHTIVVYKNKNVNLLTVNGKTATPIFDYGTNMMENNGSLYIGGYPVATRSKYSYARLLGGMEKYQYIGCIKDFSIDEKQDNFFTYKLSGDTVVNMCSLY